MYCKNCMYYAIDEETEKAYCIEKKARNLNPWIQSDQANLVQQQDCWFKSQQEKREATIRTQQIVDLFKNAGQ